MRVAKTIDAITPTVSKFEELKAKGKEYDPKIYELGSLYQDYSNSIERIKKRIRQLHSLAQRHVSVRASLGLALSNEF